MKLIDRLLYVKLYVNQAYGHMNVPLNIFNTTLTLAVLLKLGNVSMWYSVGIGLFAFLFMLVLGYFIVKTGVTAREQSINNQYNPELQALLRK
jgi:hypothetical protein